MNPKLQDAISVFRELGWHNVSPGNINTLPLGTPEQKRVAKDGLKSGPWGTWGTSRWKSYVGKPRQASALFIFAICIGVDAKRVVSLCGSQNVNYDPTVFYPMLVKAVELRGEKFASSFLSALFTSQSGRFLFWNVGDFGHPAIHIVNSMDIEIPQHIEYIQTWAQHAIPWNPPPNFSPNLELHKKRFAEHIRAGVALTVPAAGSFGAIVHYGVKQDCMCRDEAVELAFAGLDSSIRPGDRKAWIKTLDELEIADHEILSRTQLLIPLLSSGDVAVITRFAPTLIEGNADELLTEILSASLTVSTKKGKLLVLKAAQKRPRPHDAEEISPWLSILAGDKDGTVAKNALKLIEIWEIDAETFGDEPIEVQGLWKETPPLWTPPPFELGEVSPAALTDLAAEIMARQESVVHDIVTERFLAVANTVAHQDPEAARTALAGIRHNNWFGLDLIDELENWVKKQKADYDRRDRPGNATLQPDARDYTIATRLGEFPCILSTPSADNLSVTIPDLVARLELLIKEGYDILEPDLSLALMRLDVDSITPESITALTHMTAPIILQSGKKMSGKTVGEAILAYINDPVKEPKLVKDNGYWQCESITIPKSLKIFPSRIVPQKDSYWHNSYTSGMFPFFGNGAIKGIINRGYGESDHTLGIRLRIVARRATPLPPGAAINFFAAQRSLSPMAAEDAFTAVMEAWERGLLHPGVADITYLDWSTDPPKNLAALANVLDDFARRAC